MPMTKILEPTLVFQIVLQYSYAKYIILILFLSFLFNLRNFSVVFYINI